jgi:hypothetical protein
MSTARPSSRLGQKILAFVAAAFGLVTIVAGGRVLAGADPGYIVFRPLLIYNATMGFAYLAAAIIMLRNLNRGKFAAATIFLLNLLVLGVIGSLYVAGSAVAIDSIRAMTFRTGVWLVLFLGLAWLGRASHTPGT